MAADTFDLVNVNTAPLAGAGQFRYTQLLADGVPPPTRAAGDGVTADAARGFTVSVVVVTPPYVAEIVTLVAVATVPAVIWNVAEVAPDGTVTLAGTAADAREVLRVTTAPLGGAAPFRDTVPIAVAPDKTETGLAVSDFTITATTVRLADPTEPDNAPFTVAFCWVVAAPAVALNVALTAPAATATEGGTIT